MDVAADPEDTVPEAASADVGFLTGQLPSLFLVTFT